MSVQSMPIVTVCDGIVTTLSTDVASFFEKAHRSVIASIETIVKTLPSDRLHNFVQTVVTRANPSGGAPIQSKAYRLTRDGFTFLAMGFTGAKAQAFKWAYIDAFNKMEAQLRNSTAEQSSEVPTLNPAQQLLVRQAVASRAKIESKNYQTIYRAIYNRFQISRYDQLPQTDLNECLKFIQEVNLSVPVAKPVDVDDIPEYRRITEHDCDQLLGFVYSVKYLHRRELEMFYHFLKAAKSPYADRFYEAINDSAITSLERFLERSGYTVKDLECYHSWLAHHR